MNNVQNVSHVYYNLPSLESFKGEPRVLSNAYQMHNRSAALRTFASHRSSGVDKDPADPATWGPTKHRMLTSVVGYLELDCVLDCLR
jgi:hypothetical protein